jgi:hypothetical protein
MYGTEDHTYSNLIDVKVNTPVSGGGLISSVVEFGRRDIQEYKAIHKEDLDNRRTVFKEYAQDWLDSMSSLRMAQALNKEIASTVGVQEKSVDDVIVTTSDQSFDDWIEVGSNPLYITDSESELDEQAVDKAIVDAIANIEFGENIDWHTKSLHDLLLIDAATLGGESVEYFSADGHDHDTVYLGLTSKASDSDKLDGVDSSGYATSGHAHSALTYWPIGSIYQSTVSTSPATLFGGGTWVALEGKFLVGKASAGTFNTAGATGGEETHQLTEAEMPSHNHWLRERYGTDTAGTNGLPLASNSDTYRIHHTTAITDAGSDYAHNNLPPYEVVYMWKRTA